MNHIETAKKALQRAIAIMDATNVSPTCREELQQALTGLEDEPLQLLKLTHWGNVDPTEVRVEICGNGHYVLAEDLATLFKAQAESLAAEVKANLPEVTP
jgi:hypothetical protein